MNLENELEAIRRLPILRSVAPAAQKLLCFGGERITFEPGQAIFREGDPSDAVYIVLEGTVEALAASPGSAPRTSKPVSDKLLGKTGVMAAVPRTTSAFAKTQVQALRIPRDVFFAVIRDNPDAAMDLIHVLSRRVSGAGES